MSKTTRTLAILAAATAMCANAADTHDYSTYVMLKGKTTLDYDVGGWPGADKWNPAGVMSNECCYLIPSGKTLTSKTSAAANYPSGGTWPGQELAIQGTFAVTATGGRGRAAVTPHLALLPGGKIAISSAYGTIRGDTLDIRGTAGNPSLITYDYTNGDSKPSYYAKLDIAFTGDADSVVKFQYTATSEANYSIFQRAYRVTGGFANFLGTVIVDGEATWLRPETTATTFDIGGTLWVTNGASIYIDTVSPTFGSLVMAGGTTLQIASGKSVTVNGPLSIAEGAKIVVDGTTSFKTDYDTGSNSPLELPVISVCGAANAAAVDRDVLFAAIKAGSEGLVHLGGIPRLKLVEAARGDGGVDFKLSHDSFVAQITNCGANVGPYGDGYLDYLSDGKEISPDKDYYVPALNVYFETPYTFPGRSWTIYMGSDRTFGFYGGDSITVQDLRIIGSGSGKFRQMSKNIYAYLFGNATIYGSVNFRVSGNKRFCLESNLSGPGDIVVTLDNAKIIEKGSDCCGTLSLGGDNSSYAGRFLVGWGKPAVENVEGLTNLTLRATSSASLGGALDTFTFDAVKIADTCTLTIVSNSTFDAENRGWCLLDGSTIDVDASVTAAMLETVTFGGAVVKKGAGTLILGGAAKHYDGENDAAVDTPDGASFRVAAGGFGATSASALSGVSVTFAAGTKLLAFPETDGLVLGSAPTFEGGTLPVEIVNEDALEVGTVNILTLPTAVPFDTATLSVAHLRKFNTSAVQSRVDGDNTVYYVTFAKVGTRLILR